MEEKWNKADANNRKAKAILGALVDIIDSGEKMDEKYCEMVRAAYDYIVCNDRIFASIDN